MLDSAGVVNVDDLLQVVSLFASLASLILAVLAIWIALYGKRETDRTHRQTQALLTEIKSDAKSVAQVAMPELKAYGESVREYVFRGGDQSDLSRLERNVNASFEGLEAKLAELQVQDDMPRMRAMAAELEERLEGSKESLRTQIREADDIHITVESDQAAWQVNAGRDWWPFLRYFLMRLKLTRDSYGTSWHFSKSSGAEPPTSPSRTVLRARAVHDTSCPVEELGLSDGDTLTLKMMDGAPRSQQSDDS